MEKESEAGTHYPMAQLAKAFESLDINKDNETQDRLKQKIDSWVKTIIGMKEGTIKVGSRIPVKNLPKWVTLNVLSGGFATGDAISGGKLLNHEINLKSELGLTKTPDRLPLNLHYLSENGFLSVLKMLENGFYRISCPEEGALMVAAWLAHNNYSEKARNLIDILSPYFSQLRFFPITSETRLAKRIKLHKQSINHTISQLKYLKSSLSVKKMNESVLIWQPLYYKALTLFFETVSGDTPDLVPNPEKNPNKPYNIIGGWPCQIFPEGWKEKVEEFCNEHHRKNNNERLCTNQTNKMRNLGKMYYYLTKCRKGNSNNLTRKEVGMIRSILAGFNNKHGVPHSDRFGEHRRDVLSRIPLNKEKISKILIKRLQKFPGEEGIDNLDDILHPIVSEEGDFHNLLYGLTIPKIYEAKIMRCYNASVSEIFTKRIVKSSDELGLFLPQISGYAFASSFPDPSLEYLVMQLYRAFRRRRSLLLLDLQHQIRFEELPWVNAIQNYKKPDENDTINLFNIFQEFIAISFSYFPHRILSNKFLQEIMQYSKELGIHMPICEEIAADIFMGTFTQKFLNAAKIAGGLLEGTLYEVYYDIPYSKIKKMNADQEEYGRKISKEFNELCDEKAHLELVESTNGVVFNGKIIEANQIITTQNLAVVFDEFKLVEKLKKKLLDLSKTCFSWIIKRQSHEILHWRSKLKMWKNCAYAWRQMIFYLSFVTEDELWEFVTWSTDIIGKSNERIKKIIEPYYWGLVQAIRMSSNKGESKNYTGDVFLGWLGKKKVK